MSRPKKDPAIRQKEFTDAAEKLFFEKGYDATSVQDVLSAVGGESLSPSVFYYYFPSKEKLLEATIQEYVSRYVEGIAQILKDKSAALSQKTGRVISEIQTAVSHFYQVGLYFEKDKGYSRQIYEIIAGKVFSHLIDPTQRLIEESLQSGQLPQTNLIKAMPPRRMAYLLLYACYSLFHKETEENYLSEIEKTVTLLPLILEQILGLPAGSLGDAAITGVKGTE
jgi:AcrR family transcriptional regulator